MSSLSLVVNPAAGGGSDRTDAIVTAVRAAGVDPAVYQPGSRSESTRILAELAQACAERVIVAGGDGMVHLAAQAFATTATVLGIVSTGTGNDSATGLGLGADIDAAVRSALGEPTAIDVIELGDRYAVSIATLGFSVAVNQRADRIRFPRGSSRYTVATLAELPRLASHELELVVDGVTHQRRVALVAIANTSYFGGGMQVAPSADPTDGLLDVVVIGASSRVRFGRLLPTVFSGRHVRLEEVEVWRGREIEVRGATTAVWADGEPVCGLPVTARAMPDALLVAGVSLPPAVTSRGAH